MQYNKNATERAKEDIKGVMKALNDHLLAKTFLVGERISLADIAVCCTLLSLYKQVMDPSFRGAYQNVNRWFTTVVNQPNAKAVLGEVVLCSKEAQFDAKKFAEFSGKRDKKKEPEKKKEKPAEKAEEEDDGMPKEPKAKDPLAALPKGTFDLEEWKRFYSNNDEDDSIKWFWEHFDAEHYSIWRSDYKFNNELTMVFMSCNLVGGMFQRLEKMKKNAFASAILFGENNNSSISGFVHMLCNSKPYKNL